MKIHENSFTAVDEKGNQYRIHNFVDTVDQRPAKDMNATIKVLRSLVTDSGEEVRRLQKGVYELVKHGLTLRSDDHVAP